MGFVEEARKRFRDAGTLERRHVERGCRQASREPSIAPEIRQKNDAKPKKHKEHQLIDK
jgi:hypothetical protein